MKFFRSLDNLARDHTERAVEVIASVMNDQLAEDRDRLNASQQLLDRGHGKPLAATIALPASRQQAALLAGMSEEELIARLQRNQLPRLLPPGPVETYPTPEYPLEGDIEPDTDPLLL